MFCSFFFNPFGSQWVLWDKHCRSWNTWKLRAEGMSGVEIVSILSPHHCDSKLAVLILCFCLALLLEHLIGHVCVRNLEGLDGHFVVNSKSPAGVWQPLEVRWDLCSVQRMLFFVRWFIITVHSWNHQFKFWGLNCEIVTISTHKNSRGRFRRDGLTYCPN